MNVINSIKMVITVLLLLIPCNLFAYENAYSDSFKTSKKNYVTLASSVPYNSTINALITTNDNLTTGFNFPQTPDGIGAFQTEKGKVDLFVNHELENETGQNGFAKVSKLTLNQSNPSIINAELVINGSERYKALCSSYLANGYGFIHPVYFTNEETNDGLVVSIDVTNNTVKELPWLGKFSHENTIHVPYFSNTANKTVMLAFEDGDATESELYMYVANSPNDLLNGKGNLYVFGIENNSTSNSQSSWNNIYYGNGTVNGKFIPLEWNYMTQNETELDNEAIDKGGFQFIRPEDGATDKRNGFNNIVYMVETGSDVDENDQKIPPSSVNKQNFTNGRIYQFTFNDPIDPTKATIKVFADGNDPQAPGHNMMINPDNVDTSLNSIMIQEDHNDYNRYKPTSPYNITNNAKIINVDLKTNEFKTVGYVNQYEDQNADHGEWESSGILDATEFFGEGAWILDVQVHTLNEGGQLLLMKIPNT